MARHLAEAYADQMSSPASIKHRIIETLYCEALILSDEVRSAFIPAEDQGEGHATDKVAMAISCEGLRAASRMMQAITWLLNHRAHLAGELNDTQLRRDSSLHPCPAASQSQLALLDPRRRELVRSVERFHERLIRLDRSWRQVEPKRLNAVSALKQRLLKRASR